MVFCFPNFLSTFLVQGHFCTSKSLFLPATLLLCAYVKAATPASDTHGCERNRGLLEKLVLTAEPNSSFNRNIYWSKGGPPPLYPKGSISCFLLLFLTLPAFCSFTLPFLPPFSPSLLWWVHSPLLLLPHLFWCLPKFPRSSSTHCPTQQKIFCLMGCPRLSCDILPVPSLHFRGSEMGGSRDSRFCTAGGMG